MRKDDNDWSIIHWTENEHQVAINGSEYEVDPDTAALCHSILLLVDAVNDKKVGQYGKEMDSGCNQASGCFEGKPRC
jgi:hypothetical protein